jgi:hypothetical protein
MYMSKFIPNIVYIIYLLIFFANDTLQRFTKLVWNCQLHGYCQILLIIFIVHLCRLSPPSFPHCLSVCLYFMISYDYSIFLISCFILFICVECYFFS